MIIYKVHVEDGSPLTKNDMNKLGERGWRLVGCFCRDGYPDKEFWYYFIREEET